MENDWKEISRLMGKSVIWIKNAWEQVLNRANICMDQRLRRNITIYIEELKSTIEQSNTSDQENDIEEFKQTNKRRCGVERKVENQAIANNNSINDVNEINQQNDLDEGKAAQLIVIAKANMKPHTRKDMIKTVQNNGKHE